MNRVAFISQTENIAKQIEELLGKFETLCRTQGDNEIMRCIGMMLADAHNASAQLFQMQNSPMIYRHKNASDPERMITEYIQNHLKGAAFLANTTITAMPESKQHRCYADEITLLVRLAEQLDDSLNADMGALERGLEALKDLRTASDDE